MNDTTTQPAQGEAQSAPGLAAPARSPMRSRTPFVAALALLLAVLTLALLAWHWYTTRGAIEGLRLDVARRLAEGDALNKQAKLLAEQSRDSSAEAQVKLGVLEARLAESQSQQIALEALYQELSRNKDEWAFAEIEQSLLIAAQQLQLAGNVKAALIALQNADARLQRMDRPQLTPLRKAIARDVDRLQALPYVDTVGMSARLDNVIAAIDALPLAMELRPTETAESETARPVSSNAWTRFWREAWEEVKQLVRVQHMDRPDVPLLSPSQTFFLRENLKLRLLSARLALLARDQASYKADLNAAREWIVRYYDTRERAVGNALTTLRNLQENDIDIQTPDISATLDALRNLRMTRERAVR
jgi:uroporphyrin-3 C-methyltransferase